jgi:hypothetical protein
MDFIHISPMWKCLQTLANFGDDSSEVKQRCLAKPSRLALLQDLDGGTDQALNCEERSHLSGTDSILQPLSSVSLLLPTWSTLQSV